MSESQKNPSLTTAYVSNTRTRLSERAVSYDHNDEIRRLLLNDYSFMPVCYQGPGVLFRGLEAGLGLACEKGYFGLNAGDHALAHLERDLGVLLVSADFSDAYTVSRLWESGDDAIILILSADYFFEQYQRHHAATLAFAEPGVVFKYPFLCNAIAIEDIAYFIVSGAGAELLNKTFEAGQNSQFESVRDKLIVLDNKHSALSRQSFKQHLQRCLDVREIVGAKTMHVEDYPRKSS